MSDHRAFVGEVDPAGGARLWFLDGTGIRQPIARVVQHSPEGLSWGYAGKGPADAALSILKAAAGSQETAERHHQAFMQEVLARLPVNERFALPAGHVEAWLAAKGVERTAPRERSRPSAGDGADGQHPAEHMDRRGPALAARARALEERERRLLDREVRVDAMAVVVGLLPEVERATSLSAEPVRLHLDALVVDTGDDIAEVARVHGLDPRWAAGVVAGSVSRVDLAQVRHLCEGLRCTPYDLWGCAGARSIAHAYGPDTWPATTEPLMPVDGAEASGLAPSLDWPLSPGPTQPDLSPAPELTPDLGPELVR